jgi:3-hydroxyanthranilate 3,4-dioxygenase
MPIRTMRLPFNLNVWINENLPKPLGGIGNKDVFEDDTDMIFQIVKGPNARNDFHICRSDEIFYQLKGDMTLPYLEENDLRHEVQIREGDVFLLPRLVPHSPQRPAGTIGLVIERRRKAHELDAVVWFCQKCHNTLHRVEYWRDNKAMKIKEIAAAFNADKELRTCKQCGAVLPDPLPT